MKKAFLILFVLLFAGGAFVAGRWSEKRSAGAGKGGRRILYYVDPMHPSYKSDKPGIAPDCGMRLEPVYADEAGNPVSRPERKPLYYRDPQSASYRSDKPGMNPETGDELEPVYEEPGTVRLTPDRQQLIGVRYGTAEYAQAEQAIRAAGKVAIDETRVAQVYSRVEGWIEKVFADYTGQVVEKGRPLLTLYSPEMLATQQELLLAAKAHQLMHHSSLPSAAEDSNAMVDAARRRLEHWNLTPAQIAEIEHTGQPIKSITISAPITGYVTDRKAYPSQRVMGDTMLYTIVDLSRVWIVADVFEYEAPQVRVGQSATVTLASMPGRTLHAAVSYILPQVDPNTRTLKVRLDAANPGMLLKPDMFVDVEFRVAQPRVLTVPVDAVLDSGMKKTVFVDKGEGALEPRQVETGERLGERVQILKGLTAGERIVTSGTFLIDSESQLRSATSGGAPSSEPHQHAAPPAAQQPPPPTQPGEHKHD